MPILSQKLQNAIRKKTGEKASDTYHKYVFHRLQNIIVNHEKRGCSGFIENQETGTIVYVNTEPSCLSSMPPYLYRFAEDTTDYHGGPNQYARTLDELTDGILTCLNQLPHQKGTTV